MRFEVENMTCGGCARSVAKAIQSIDPGAEVTPHLAQRSIEVRSAQPIAAIAAALVHAGYPAVEAATEI
jgi:copper chaperone